MNTKWTRHDVVDGYQVDYRFTGDVMEIILLEHMSPIYCWEIEEYSGRTYRLDEAIADPVDPDNAAIVIKWVEDQIGNCSLSDIISGLINNPDLFEETPNNNIVKYVCDFTDGFYSILTYQSMTEHLNVMYYKGDTKLGWSEFLPDGSEGKLDWSNFMLSIELATMERSIRNAIRTLGVPKFISYVDNGLNVVDIGCANLNNRVLNNAEMTFTKVEQK